MTICDPRPDIERRVRVGLREIALTLAQLDLPVGLGGDSAALRIGPTEAAWLMAGSVLQMLEIGGPDGTGAALAGWQPLARRSDAK